MTDARRTITGRVEKKEHDLSLIIAHICYLGSDLWMEVRLVLCTATVNMCWKLQPEPCHCGARIHPEDFGKKLVLPFFLPTSSVAE